MRKVAVEPRIEFPSLGKCIYCGIEATKSKLTLEHIIPLGLGGRYHFLGASCLSCAEITGKFERTLLRTMMGPIRAYLELPTRRPSERPKLWPVYMFDNEQQGQAFVRGEIDLPDAQLVPTKSLRYFWMVAQFQPPGLLRGKSGMTAFDGLRLAMRNLPPLDGGKEIQRAAIKAGLNLATLGFVSQSPIDTGALSRSMAKIAHGFAIAKYGLGYFQPLLTDLILKAESNAPDVFGGTDPHDLKLGNSLHEYKIIEVGEYVVVQLQLFAQFDMPTCQVVVGRLEKAA
jgi:hypothetical protein